MPTLSHSAGRYLSLHSPPLHPISSDFYLLGGAGDPHRPVEHTLLRHQIPSPRVVTFVEFRVKASASPSAFKTILVPELAPQLALLDFCLLRRRSFITGQPVSEGS